MRGRVFCLLTWRVGLRPLILNPGRSFLSIASIALGVAVFLSMTIANRSAVESFHKAFEQITGKADLEIRGDIPEEVFPRVQSCEGIAAVTPVIETMVILPDFPGESLHLVGLDPFTASGVMAIEPQFDNAMGAGLEKWLGQVPSAAVGVDFLARHRLQQGSWIRIQGAGKPEKVNLAFLMHQSSSGSGNLMAMDLASVQELMEMRGKLSTLLVVLKQPSEKEAVIKKLRGILPLGIVIQPPAQRTKQVDIMLSAFRMNLSALSLVSLLVGVFFVGNTASASVIRRRVSLGILRATGCGRGAIMCMVLAEAGFNGLVGGLIGVLLSPVLAGFLAQPVAQTVSALYLPVESQGGWPATNECLAGVLAGVGAALLAAWIPARAAAAVDPTRVLHPGTASEIFPMPGMRLALWGACSLAGAFILSLAALDGGPAVLGFGAAFLVLTGFSLLVPVCMVLLASVLKQPCFKVGPIGRLAQDQWVRSLHRTAPTIAALAAAVSMMVGITVMIHSFRGSVIAWTNRTLKADLFIAPASNELLGLTHVLPAGAAAWWNNRPAVHALGSFREFEAHSSKDEAVTLGVVSGPARGDIDFLNGNGVKKNQELLLGKGVALSESLGRRLHLAAGDRLILQTPRGELALPVLDLYRDYTRDRGLAMIGSELFLRYWGEQGIHSLAIEFERGTTQGEMDQEAAAFMKDFGGKEVFVCYSNRMLKNRIVAIFNQTFAITSVLRTISIIVAIGGVMLTLGMLVLERAREIGVLRSMGASTGQIVGMMLAEAALIGLTASVVGLLSGAGLALVLTWVINKAFFGWSITLSYPWRELIAVPVWMISASLVAGAVPAWKAARLSPTASLRME